MKPKFGLLKLKNDDSSLLSLSQKKVLRNGTGMISRVNIIKNSTLE
jgi:hypothetical protein